MSEAPVVSQPGHRCAALLDHLARRMRAQGEEVLEPLGLRPRHLLTLTLLRDHGGSQQGLAGVLHIDRTNLVGLLNELEGDRLIERRRSRADRRRHVVELTPRGHEKLAQAEMALAGSEDVVLTALSHAERERLYQLLLKASNGLTLGAAGEAIAGDAEEGLRC